ncbi:Alpha/Beta hydrolase protein [Apiosordaria backusii]|uniref:Alpha/Beta hydrolase protein n=1 Tax=Apiosordaria backusii TaxID=314023 RepID=A0AA40BMR4_9PEZI|nr:Alpha/Beta hydrolase protein [Apiosordaria backusii]
MVDKLVPNDPRVTHHTTTLPSGHTYHYLEALPPSGTTPLATVVLVHGFPDLSFGWRYQIPYLTSSLSLRVIIPDMLGYGLTSAPSPIPPYSYKSLCTDLAALITHTSPGSPIILGGHDWGGAIVWRFALRHPSLLQGVFSICTPYNAPNSQGYLPKRTVIEQFLPNFAYQLQFEDTALESRINASGREGIRKFLNILYGSKDETTGKGHFVANVGIDLALFDPEVTVAKSQLLSEEELEFYVTEYERNGIHGPMNYYRTWDVNYQEEAEDLVKEGKSKVLVPGMIVTATRDTALPPAMAAGMEQFFERGLIKKEVNASHWATWENPEEVNKAIGEFVGELLGKGKGFKASI